MTTEREEFEKFEKMFLSGNFADVDYAIANPKILWSWHQQSVEKAVENYKQSVLEKLGDGTFMKNFMKELLTTPQLKVDEEK